MPNFTNNLDLIKPLGTENFNVSHVNGNADKVDEAYGTMTKRLEQIELNIHTFGVKGDGTDDTQALKTAFDAARDTEKVLYFPNGVYYTTETLDARGVKIKGQTQGVANLYDYTSRRLGRLGDKFFRNVEGGETVTYGEMISEALFGTVITSDVANPILTFNTNEVVFSHKDDKTIYDLNNIAIVGWIRNSNQVGIGCTYIGDDPTKYIPGNHRFNNLTVSGCGSHGIHIPSLEVTEIYNLRCNQNNGNGLRIETFTDRSGRGPFEYVTFNGGDFNENLLDGVWTNNYRKMVKFNDVWFQDNGQYSLGASNDGHDRTPPSLARDLRAGVRIDAVSEVNSFNRRGMVLIFDGCYGEMCNKLIHIKNTSGSSYLAAVKIINCFQTQFDHPQSTLYYIEAKYLYDFEIDYNRVNNDIFGMFEGVLEASGFKGQSQAYDTAPLIVKKAFERKYVNAEEVTTNSLVNNSGFWTISPSQGTDRVVTTTIPKTIVGAYPVTGVPYKHGFFFITYNHAATNGSGVVGDLFAITRDNLGKYRMTKITNNISDLNIDIDTGEVSFTCPAYKVAGLQRLDNNFFKNI